MPTIVDLFSGAGGFSLGFVQAGYTSLCAVECDPDAAASYRANIGDHVIERRIEDIASDELPNADVYLASPPCQGFSFAGKRDKGDPRNRLWYEVLRVIRDRKPTFFVLENVRGLLSAGEDKAIILAFRDIGYHVSPYLLNAADYGVPQRRLRVFFVGNRIGLANPCPPPTHAQPPRHVMFGLLPWVTVRQALGIGGGVYGLHNADRPPSVVKSSPSPLQARNGQHGLLDTPSLAIRSGVHGQPGYSPRHQAGYVPTERTDHGVIDLDEPSCAIKAGGNREADGHMGGPCPPSLPYIPLDNASPTIKSGIGNGGSQPVRHTIPGLRRLSVRECATLQDFPPSFTFHGSKTSQYRQVGNAVAVGMGRALGSAIEQSMRKT